MRKGRGPRAPWVLAGVLLLVVSTSSTALGMAPLASTRTAIEEGRPPVALTLGANLDRSGVARARELARTSAVAAAYARAHPVHKAAPKPKPKPKPRPRPRHIAAPKPTVIRNHLWIPALGISRSVSWFSCSRSTEPGNYVYRWGCAGRNNVYLFGHAYGVFRALHDAYYSGTLKVGMVAIYADAYGHRHRYEVTAWKVVSPSDITWSGSTRTSVMTLQTCVGSNSQYRLDVRLAGV